MLSPFTRRVPESEIVITATKASGPGGQNVNKTSSAAEIRWNLWRSPSFSDAEKLAMSTHPLLRTRINRLGEVVMKIKQERSFFENQRIALERLNELARTALTPVTERNLTIPKTVIRRIKTKRLQEKRVRSQKKQHRGSVQQEAE